MRSIHILVFLLVHFCAASHESYFAFAEVEYDELTGRFEVTLSATTHDLERCLNENKIIKGGMSLALKDTVQLLKIQKELNEHFKIEFSNVSNRNQSVELKIDGYEAELTGVIRLYCSSSRPVSDVKSLFITFDLLMDVFPQQQNKLTFLFREKKSTYVFLHQQIKQQIQLL
jgi:hypothetical protein